MTPSRIFSKPVLSKNSLRTVADRRFADAAVLRDTKKNAHANGAMYLAGFVIECLLKAQLLVEHTWLAKVSFETVRNDEERKRLWGLCYRSHDLDEIYANLPRLQQALESRAQYGGPTPSQLMRQVCAWSIFARYSPESETSRTAQEFIAKVKELRGYFRD